MPRLDRAIVKGSWGSLGVFLVEQSSTKASELELLASMGAGGGWAALTSSFRRSVRLSSYLSSTLPSPPLSLSCSARPSPPHAQPSVSTLLMPVSCVPTLTAQLLSRPYPCCCILFTLVARDSRLRYSHDTRATPQHLAVSEPQLAELLLIQFLDISQNVSKLGIESFLHSYPAGEPGPLPAPRLGGLSIPPPGRPTIYVLLLFFLVLVPACSGSVSLPDSMSHFFSANQAPFLDRHSMHRHLSYLLSFLLSFLRPGALCAVPFALLLCSPL